jgi:hypothetical protein
MTTPFAFIGKVDVSYGKSASGSKSKGCVQCVQNTYLLLKESRFEKSKRLSFKIDP